MNALVGAAIAPRIVFRPGPIVVHASPVVVHTSPVLHTSDTTATVIAALGVLLALAALGWQAWTFQRSGSPCAREHHARAGRRRARDHDPAERFA